MELSFPQTAPTDDAFFNKNWDGECWNCWAGTGTIAGSVRWLWTLDSSAKKKKKRIDGDSPVSALMPKSVLSYGGEYQLLME